MNTDFKQQKPMLRTLEEAQASFDLLWDHCKGLESKIEDLEEKLRTNSSNSSQSPSKDAHKQKPNDKKKKKAKLHKGKSKRKQGAQPGHKAHKRELLPTKEVDVVEKCMPAKKCDCGKKIKRSLKFRRHQVHELPVIKPMVTEYQLYEGECSDCEKIHFGELPQGVPTGMLGPRALATIGTFTGEYRISKRNVKGLFSDLYDFNISVGTVSKAEKIISKTLEKPVKEAKEAKEFIKEQKGAVHADETGHKEKGKKMWTWVAVALCVSVFLIRASRGSKVAKELLGEKFSGILNSDRWSGYYWVDAVRRQLCWAHLIRDFKKISERSGLSGKIGDELLFHTYLMFSQWHAVKDGKKSKQTFQKYMKLRRRKIEELLEHGSRGRHKKTKGTCAEILKLKSALWTFVDNENVEPTNNLAEQVIRTHVIWTKTSFGTQSAAGTTYMERVLTTVGSCKLQKRNVLNFITTAVTAYLSNTKAPSLLPDYTEKAKTQLLKAA